MKSEHPLSAAVMRSGGGARGPRVRRGDRGTRAREVAAQEAIDRVFERHPAHLAVELDAGDSGVVEIALHDGARSVERAPRVVVDRRQVADRVPYQAEDESQGRDDVADEIGVVHSGHGVRASQRDSGTAASFAANASERRW
jgi:hypothetical protein